MKNTSGLSRAKRKAVKANKKALWKKELLNYYIVGETNTSKAGIVYQKLKISTAAKPKHKKDEHPVAEWMFSAMVKLLGLKNA